MPGLRRTLPKPQSLRHFGTFSVHDENVRNRSGPGSPSDAADPTRGKTGRVPNVKHLPLPDVPKDSQMGFETIALFCTLEALCLQYLNLYRTVWWLPHSHVDRAMFFKQNFYLIDPYLTCFVVIVSARRIVWHVLKETIERSCCHRLQDWLRDVFRFVTCVASVGGLVWCSFHIVQTHPIVKMFYLCYPISIYFILFGANVSPFFELVPPFPGHAMSDGRSAFFVHSCRQSAEAVRSEVELLKTDFNNRMKQVLFNSLLSAYYTGFIPCCFAQNVLQYDLSFVTQHMGFTWLGCFIAYTVFMFPPHYCDHLHRVALHLGRWQKIEAKNFHVPYSPWSEANLWHQGALVKHSKELFRAEGIVNAAEPGNAMHLRFRMVFGNPSISCCFLLGLHVIAIGIQTVLLSRSSEWYRMLSIAMLAAANCYTLFKQTRDCVILKKVYKLEEIFQEDTSS